MIALNTLHGRTRVARAARGRVVLFLLLLAVVGVVALATFADALATQMARESGWTFTASQIAALGAPITCASPLLAGLLIDRFGPRRVVAIALIGWCGVASFGAIALPPLALAVVAPLTFDMLSGFALTAALVALRFALAPRRRAPAVVTTTLAYAYARHPLYELYRLVIGTARPEVTMLTLVVIGTLVAAAWLFVFREVDSEAGLDLRTTRPERGALLHGVADILSRPIVWSLLAIQFCHSLVYPLVFYRPLSFELMRLGVVDEAALALAVVAPVATLVAAAWSDWGLRRTRSLTRSRQPFAVLGFVVVGAAAIASTRPHVSEAAIAVLSASGIAAIRMVDVLEVDLAPRALAGRFFGVLGTGEAFLVLYVVPISTSLARQPHAYVPTVVAASVAGAGLALLLLRRLPEARPD